MAMANTAINSVNAGNNKTAMSHSIMTSTNDKVNNNNPTINQPPLQQHSNFVIAIVKLGDAADGHAGVVHGGILALLIDDVLGFAYEALEGDDQVALAATANLNINYRSPVPTSSKIHILVHLVERTERKLIWKVTVVSPDHEQLYCEGSSVYVIPRTAVQAVTSKNSSTSDASLLKYSSNSNTRAASDSTYEMG
jgi:acyl-coenzyme A thioesterase PaaI-like protein